MLYRVLKFQPDYLKLAGRLVTKHRHTLTLPYNGGEMVSIEDVLTGECFYIRERHLQEERQEAKWHTLNTMQTETPGHS
jgi:hypothetical protein